MNKLKALISGLKGKIQLIFIVVFTLASLVFGVTMYLSLRPDLLTRNISELSNTARLISNLAEMYIGETIRNYLETRAIETRKAAEYFYGKYLDGELSEAEAYARFSSLLLNPDYGKIGETGYLAGVSTKGILAIHPYSQGADASGYEFMQKATRMKNGYIEYEWANKGEEVARDKAGGMSYFEPWDIIVWASSYKSEFQSLIDLSSIKSIVAGIEIGEEGMTFILNGKGQMVQHETVGGRTVLGLQDRTGRSFVKEIIETAKAEPEEPHIVSIPGFLWADGNPAAIIAAYTYIPSMDLIAGAGIPSEEIFMILRKAILLLLIIVLVFFVVINIVVNLIFTNILKPVRAIQEITAAVSSGDLSRRVMVDSEDEIGQMAGRFNEIIGKFESMLQDIKQTSTVLSDSVQELSVSSQEIASTSNQQAAAVKEMVSTMEDSDELSKSIAVKVDEVATVAHNTKSTVDDGFTTIQQSLAKMEEIREANSETITGIKTLSESIDNIWEIVNIINGIADQTKIIAFNAELEASAAGDAGKNFQIVASEIRRLADNTVSSTSEIRTKINEIQHSSDRLIIASEEGTEKVKAGWELSNTLRSLFEDILSSSEISTGSAEQIATSIKQQVSAFEQILQTLKQISEGIDNFTVSTKATSTASTNLKEQADRLNRIIDEYRVKGERHHG